MSSDNKTSNSRKAPSFNGQAESAFGRRSYTAAIKTNVEFSGAAASAFSNKRDSSSASEPHAVSEAHALPVLPLPVTKSRFSTALLSNSDISAFGKHSRPPLPEKIAFDTVASNAFGNKSVQKPDNTNTFDNAASSAFSKKHNDADGNNGNNGFNDAAANAFGKKRVKETRPEHNPAAGVLIEKTNTLWALMSNIMPEVPKKREWISSGIGQKKKKLEAAAIINTKKKPDITNTDLFPSLDSKPITKSSSTASLNANATPPMSKSSSTLSFAEIMRKRKEQEELEAAQEANRLAEEAAERERESYIYGTSISVRIGAPPINDDSLCGYMEDENYDNVQENENDLDYVHPSERSKQKYYQTPEDDYSLSDEEEEDYDNTW